MTFISNLIDAMFSTLPVWAIVLIAAIAVIGYYVFLLFKPHMGKLVAIIQRNARRPVASECSPVAFDHEELRLEVPTHWNLSEPKFDELARRRQEFLAASQSTSKAIIVDFTHCRSYNDHAAWTLIQFIQHSEAENEAHTYVRFPRLEDAKMTAPKASLRAVCERMRNVSFQEV